MFPKDLKRKRLDTDAGKSYVRIRKIDIRCKRKRTGSK